MLIIVKARWGVHGDSFPSSSVSAFRSFSLPFDLWHHLQGFFFFFFLPTEAFLSPWLHSPFTYTTPITFISIYLGSQFLFFHLFLFHVVILNLGFVSPWIPALAWTPYLLSESIHPFSIFVCVDWWAVAIHKDTRIFRSLNYYWISLQCTVWFLYVWMSSNYC